MWRAQPPGTTLHGMLVMTTPFQHAHAMNPFDMRRVAAISVSLDTPAVEGSAAATETESAGSTCSWHHHDQPVRHQLFPYAQQLPDAAGLLRYTVLLRLSEDALQSSQCLRQMPEAQQHSFLLKFESLTLEAKTAAGDVALPITSKALNARALQWFRQHNQKVVRPLSAARKAITKSLKAKAIIGKAIVASQAKSIKQKLLTLNKHGVLDSVEGVLPVVRASGRPKTTCVGMLEGWNYNSRTGKRSYPMVRSKAERMQGSVVLEEGMTAAAAAAVVLPAAAPLQKGQARKQKRHKTTTNKLPLAGK
ncbi:hypothetical protein COO60DRAFT_1624465 [Scenedesmus sp. NREL 46B-D3]|nr:hypothetical protein COO60DRAFT_1624465 [Scenedesmus sp. NREL 46B-D3]